MRIRYRIVEWCRGYRIDYGPWYGSYASAIKMAHEYDSEISTGIVETEEY